MDLTLNGTAPNRTYIELRLVKFTAAGRGKNETLSMKANDDGETFTVTSGRTGVRAGRNKAVSTVYPMEDWEYFYSNKVRMGYTVTKTEELERREIKKSGEYLSIRDPQVQDLVSILLTAANQVMEEQYSVTLDDISDEMLSLGQNILTELAKAGDKVSVAEFNNHLLQLWTAIPRPAKNLAKMKVSMKSEYQEKIQKEQELLDFLVSMLRGNRSEVSGKTILDANGLDIRPVTKDEEKMLKDKMAGDRARYLRAWKVNNRATDAAFNAYVANHPSCQKEDGISHLFHGSGTENFWSILCTGLYLNPQGVVISGKAFGHGLYFAPKAKKSIGYTSSMGSGWRRGNSDKAYLAVFQVATGNIYDIYRNGGSGYGNCPDNYEELQQRQPDADCLWAYSRESCSNSYLQNDEVIVYREDQATIEYLIEFSA